VEQPWQVLCVVVMVIVLLMLCLKPTKPTVVQSTGEMQQHTCCAMCTHAACALVVRAHPILGVKDSWICLLSCTVLLLSHALNAACCGAPDA
jgi:hypothetical protein